MRHSVLSMLLVSMMALHTLAKSVNVDRHNLFSADVYKELKKSEAGNFAVSSISAQTILALVYEGAEGETATQLSTALHLPANREKIQEIFRELTADLQSTEKYTLSSANKIYVKDGYEIKDGFRKLAENDFHAEVEDIDFLKEDAADKMNKWVEGKTHDKIKNLISKDDIDDDTISILINALFFEGKWQLQFNKAGTHKKPFYVDVNTKKETDMMGRNEHFNYHESKELDATFLELSFEGGDATMTFVLPNENKSLSSLEERIQDVIVAPKYDHSAKIEVKIPKFKIESSVKFTDILQNLGVTQAFSDAAEFNDIVENKPLRIKKVLQTTFLEVQETGVTAAAATAGIMETESLVQGHFIADHPFIYYIKVKEVVTFIGRYVSP